MPCRHRPPPHHPHHHHHHHHHENLSKNLVTEHMFGRSAQVGHKLLNCDVSYLLIVFLHRGCLFRNCQRSQNYYASAGTWPQKNSLQQQTLNVNQSRSIPQNCNRRDLLIYRNESVHVSHYPTSFLASKTCDFL